MTESLKKIVDQSLSELPNTKIIQSISELGTDAVNNSFELNSQSDDSINNKELLKMEIEQLKRENAFLKRKIEQLKKGNFPNKPQLIKRQSLNCINVLKKKADSKQFSQQNSVNFILKEIQSILKSLASLHKLQTEEKKWAMEQLNKNQLDLEEANIIQSDKQYKQKMKKKLQMIPLAKQETRYGCLLEVFSEFYSVKMDEEKKMKEKIQKYIQKTIEISRRLIQNANNKAHEKYLRSSCIYQSDHINSDTSIINHTMSSNNIQFLHRKLLKTHIPDKHQLSYSTIDAQYLQRQVD